MKFFSFVFCLLIGTISSAQSFISPLDDDDIAWMKSVVVQLKNSEEMKGSKFSSFTLINGQLKSFTLKKENKEKVKFKAQEIKLVKIEPNGFAKTMMKINSPNLKKAIEKDYSAIDKMKYVIFEQVEIKEGKFSLLQLLNPGLDERIKVYLDPNANKTVSVLGIIGGEDKSYFVKKDDAVFHLKKKNYKKAIAKLYMDSEKMMELFKSNKIDPKFREFPAHIALYNETF